MENVLLDRIVEEVIRRIESMNRKKILVLIRKDCMRNIDIIESMVETIKDMNIEVHIGYECIKDENLYTDIYCKQLKQVEFPKEESEMEVLLSNNIYESILINYIGLKEVKNIMNMNINKGFTGAIFNALYKGIDIYTDVYEFRGECKNLGLKSMVQNVVGNLKSLNINMFHEILKGKAFNNEFDKDNKTKVLNIDKKVITMKDLYNHNNEIIVSSDAIITAMAEDYIRDQNILVRRR